MEHLQNAELHEKRKRTLTWRIAWKREQAEAPQRSMPVYAYPTCSDRHIRTFFFGFGGADNLLWLTRERQVVGCTYPSSAFNKKKYREDRVWKREQTEAPQKKCVRICLSDLLGQTHTDILLRLRRYGQPFVAHSWVASGWLYLSQFRFQQGTKGASGKGGCAVRKRIRTSIVKLSVWCGYADFLSAMLPVPMTSPYHVRGESSARFHLRQEEQQKKKRQAPVKVPLSHSHERVVRLPIV